MSDSSAAWYVRPVFFVADCQASLRFYTALGFSESWRYEEQGELRVVQVTRNDFELILNHRAERVGGGRIFFSLEDGEVTALLATLGGTGIEAEDGYWGMPVKVLRDPDGNELFFTPPA